LATAATLLLLVGCAARTPERPSPPAAATPPATRPTARRQVPVFYVAADIPPVPQQMIDRLLAAAADSEPARQGRRPWFIAVHQNRGPGLNVDRRYFRMMLYFSPDAATPRSRTGRFLLYWWWTGDVITTRDYVQISRPNAPFGDRLEVPKVADLPYEIQHTHPPPPGEPQWVQFVDFARVVEDDENLIPPYLIARSQRDPGLYALANGTDESGVSVFARWTPIGFLPMRMGWPWAGSPWGDL
jgi:hypothetical protein